MERQAMQRRVEAAPAWAVGGGDDPLARAASDGLDRVASELQLIAERLREVAAFRAALARASAGDDEDRIDYLHA